MSAEGRAARGAALALPGVAVVTLALAGGPPSWRATLPWAIPAAALAAAGYARGWLRPRTRGAAAALACLAGLAVWTAASALWAPSASPALEEATRALLYLAVFAAVAGAVRGVDDLAALTLVLAAACAVLEVAAVGRLALAADQTWFAFGRLAWLDAYPNTTAALMLCGLWTGCGVAGQRSLPPQARIAGQALAALSLALVLVTQSRGALDALVVGGALTLVLARSRAQLAGPLALAAAALLPAWLGLGAAFHAGADPPSRRVAAGLVVAAGAGALGGAVLLRAERLRVGLPRPGALRAAVAALCVLGLAAGLAAHVPAHATRAWRTFTRVDRREGPPPADHLLRFDSNRYDYWRVAVLVLRSHPALGDGAGSFGVGYRALGRSEERPRQAHGEVWELAATLGLPGLVLFAAVVAIGLAGLIAAARAPGASALAAAALGACLVTVLHAQVDWDWQVPAAVLPAVSLLAAGAALSGRRGPRP